MERGIGSFVRYVHNIYLLPYLQLGDFHPPGLNTYLPFLEHILKTPTGAIMVLFLILACALIWFRALPNTRVILVLFAVYILLASVVKPARDFHHGIYLFGLVLLSWAPRLFLILRLIRFNLLPYIVISWVSTLFNPGWSLFQTSHPFYQANGGVLLILCGVPILFTVLAYTRRQT